MTPHPKPTVVKDKDWLKVVRQRQCWAQGRIVHRCQDTMGKGRSEASHLDGKSLDSRCLPMCGFVHRTAPWSWHSGQKSFCVLLGVTKDELIAEAEAAYRQWKGGGQ